MAVFFGAWMLACCLTGRARADALALDAKQIIVCIAPDNHSSEGKLQLFHRDAKGGWQADSQPWPVLFGMNGLAWGRGLNPDQDGPHKVENDHRNPAGLFKIGLVLGNGPALPAGSKGWPYHQVTERDAWIDLPELADLGYNHLYTLPKDAPFPPWWHREKMKLHDYAYEYLVTIEHNYNDPDMHSGNQIFFHVRRGEHYRTAGCTTMELGRLEQLVSWLDPNGNPMLAELTRADYERVWKDWHLPPPEVVVALGR